MSDLNKVVVNNMEKRQRDNLLKVCGRGWPFTDIQTPVSSSDRGGKSAEDRILRHSGTPRGQPGAVRQHAWSAQPSGGNRSLLTHGVDHAYSQESTSVGHPSSSP
jgi:hypothetical protein